MSRYESSWYKMSGYEIPTPILEPGNENVDGQTDGQTNGQKTDKQTQNYTNFKRNLAMMVIYVPVKFEFDWTNRF